MKSKSIDALNYKATESIQSMGGNIRLARKLRGESAEEFAKRCFISKPTLLKIENGNPNVSIGAIASVLSILSDEQSIANLGAHERDLVGQEGLTHLKNKKTKGLDNEF